MTTFHDAMWAEASRDHAAESHERAVAMASVALAGLVPFLHAASSTAEYDQRLALVRARAEELLLAHTADTAAHEQALDQVRADFETLHRGRVAATLTAALAAAEAAEDKAGKCEGSGDRIPASGTRANTIYPHNTVADSTCEECGKSFSALSVDSAGMVRIPSHKKGSDKTASVKTAAEDNKPYGNVTYADPKNGKYPIDTEKHVRAAWSYINHPDNAAKYPINGVSLDSVKSKIKSAAERLGIEIEAVKTAGWESVHIAAGRPIYEIADEIQRVWGPNVNYAAKPYLDAMKSLSSIDDKFYEDDGSHIIQYFLSNASSFRGDAAKTLKAELRGMVKRGSLHDEAGVVPPFGREVVRALTSSITDEEIIEAEAILGKAAADEGKVAGSPTKCKFCEKTPVIRALWWDSTGKRIVETGYYCEDHQNSARNWSGGTVQVGAVPRTSATGAAHVATIVCAKCTAGHTPDGADCNYCDGAGSLDPTTAMIKAADGWEQGITAESFLTEAVNSDAKGADRYQKTPHPQQAEWIHDAWGGEGDLAEKTREQGRAGKNRGVAKDEETLKDTTPSAAQAIGAKHTADSSDYSGGWARANEDWGTMQHGDTGQVVHLYRGKGNKARFYDEDGQQVGPEQSNVAPAVAWALSNGYHNPDLAAAGIFPGRASSLITAEAVGVHTFDSTGEAYDASQTSDDIKDGDVLHVPSEGVTGFLYQAWPVAMHHGPEGPGEFHKFTDDGQNAMAEGYSDSVAKAAEVHGGAQKEGSMIKHADIAALTRRLERLNGQQVHVTFTSDWGVDHASGTLAFRDGHAIITTGSGAVHSIPVHNVMAAEGTGWSDLDPGAGSRPDREPSFLDWISAPIGHGLIPSGATGSINSTVTLTANNPYSSNPYDADGPGSPNAGNVASPAAPPPVDSSQQAQTTRPRVQPTDGGTGYSPENYPTQMGDEKRQVGPVDRSADTLVVTPAGQPNRSAALLAAQQVFTDPPVRDPREVKVGAITASVLTTNPGMDVDTARAVAEATVDRYAGVGGS